MTFRRAWIVATLLLATAPVRADEPAAGSHARAWLALLPGGGQFLLGRPVEGTLYAAATAGFAGWGWWAWRHREPGALDAPLLWAQHVYVVSAYSAYRDVQFRLGETSRVDPTSTRHLAGAPFRPAQLLDPWVIGFGLLGCGLNWLAIRHDHAARGWRDVDGMRYLGERFGRSAAPPAFAAYWIPVSWGAGVSEEMLFRGMLQADWEARWGDTAGWLAASGVFGLAHVTAISRPDAWLQGGFAALAGLFLGWRYQRTGYRLSEPVAAHAWFDIAAGVTVFALDPKNNPLGARITFRY